jgi:PDZ domain-containing protein
MRRRTVASVLACVLLAALFGVAALLPVPYVTMSPGPTVDVLGEADGEPIVAVEGRQTYPTDGSLELTTVSVSGPAQDVGLAEAVTAWFDRTRAVYPRDSVYPPDQSEEEVETESSVQMVSSQDTAIAAALTELGYDTPVAAEVLAVTKGSPADGKLETRDQILSVNGTEVTAPAEVSEAVQASGVGGEAEFEVRRDGRVESVVVTTEAAPGDPEHAVVGVVVGQGYDFPFDVSVNLSEDIGGPSAGLVFALAVYDTLTPGALTGGKNVAGTGTMSPEGRVGPIGGIQQKIVAAADSGATVFLVPPGNCDAALEAAVDEEIRLVEAGTLHSAIESVRAYVRDPEADLPECE